MDLAAASLWGVPLDTVLATASVLLTAGIADLLLRWLVRRTVRRDRSAAPEATPAERERVAWFDRALGDAVAPVEMLIWVAAGHAALDPLVELLLPDAIGGRVAAGLMWARDVGALAALFWLLTRLARVAQAALLSLAGRTRNVWDDALLPVAARAARVLLPILALILGVQLLPLPSDFQSVLRTVLSLILIGATSFLLYLGVEAATSLVLHRYRIDQPDNLEARAIYTQVMVLRRIATVVIVIVAGGSMLMVFESVRQFGTSILASAGIAGIIVGFAAQRSIATLVAGFQIAITQPIRVDDVVIVENEWGRIEEITLSYATIRIWDQRRLVVPITYFLERPFQNWTRKSADLIGAVLFYVDYSVPLGAMRQELDRILSASPYWDGRVKVLQVTDTREHVIEVRVLASAADAGKAWDLRCEIREKLVQFLQERYPESLPRLRAQLEMAPADAHAGAREG